MRPNSSVTKAIFHFSDKYHNAANSTVHYRYSPHVTADQSAARSGERAPANHWRGFEYADSGSVYGLLEKWVNMKAETDHRSGQH